MAAPHTSIAGLRRDSEPASNLPRFHANLGAEYSIAQIAGDQELANIHQDWDRLSSESTQPNVFTTFNWFQAWNRRLAEVSHSTRRPNVLAVRKRGKLTGISPLIYRRASRLGFGIRKLEFVGPDADYNDLVLGNDPEDQIFAVIRFLSETQNQWDLVDLRNLRAVGKFPALIESALSRAGLPYRLRPEKGGYPCMPVDGPWEEWLRRRSHASRRTFRRQQLQLTRLKAQGLSIRIIEHPHRESDLIEKLTSLDAAAGLNGKRGQFVAKHREVFQTLIETLGARGWIVVAIMELHNRPIAWQLWFRSGEALWGYQTAFDRAAARLSPGTMLVPAMMDYAFQRRYTELDFLRGDEAYKMRWATGHHHTFQLQIWNQHWKSRARAGIYLDLKEAVYRRLGKVE